MALDEFQKKQLAKLREYNESSYPEASIYTVLLDLVQGNSLAEVFLMLQEVAKDLEIESELDKIRAEKV